MTANKSGHRRPRPQQQQLACTDPKQLFQQWRSRIKAHLEAETGRATKLAAALEVPRQSVSDWFTAQRHQPPSWVTHALLDNPALYLFAIPSKTPDQIHRHE